MSEMASNIVAVASLIVAVGALLVFVSIGYLLVRLAQAIELIETRDRGGSRNREDSQSN